MMDMFMKNFFLIFVCLLFGVCGSMLVFFDSGLVVFFQWCYLVVGCSDVSDICQWWKVFGVLELDSLL